MFCVSETEATAIRDAFFKDGEFSAAVEFRRLFPGITDTSKARYWARVIAGWKPMAPSPTTAPKFSGAKIG
jgi:hypothetical protein